jgi:predicted nuclease with TOPRIM domain
MVKTVNKCQLTYLLLVFLCSGDIEMNPGPAGAKSSHKPITRTQSTLSQSESGDLQCNALEQPTLLDILKEIKELKADITGKVDNCKKELKAEIKGLRTENETMRSDLNMVMKTNRQLQDRIDDLENRSRRPNLIFSGLQETENESWEQSEKNVKGFIKDILDIIEDVCIGRAHRMGKIRRTR